MSNSAEVGYFDSNYGKAIKNRGGGGQCILNLNFFLQMFFFLPLNVNI